MRWTGTWLVIIGLLLSSDAAAERRGRPGARELLRASELIRRDRCDEAIPLLRRANEIGGLVNALWNLAECYGLLNRPQLAIDAYRDFIEHPGSSRNEEIEARAAVARLEALLATVNVSCNIDGALVRVDGQDGGTSPTDVFLGPGDHMIEVSSPGFETWSQEITTGAGERRELRAHLVPRPGELFVESRPAAAEVWVDGELRGNAPWVGELAGGSHVLELRLTGRRVQQRQVVVLPGQRSHVQVNLPPAQGAVAVATDAPRARLRVNDEPRGTSPFAPLRLEPGSHLLEVSAPRHSAWSGTIDVADGRTTRVEVDLASTRGLRQGWFWSLAVVTLATAVTGAALLVTGFQHEDDYSRHADAIESGLANPFELALHRDLGQESLALAESYQTSGIVLLGTAGAALVATVIVGALTRFARAAASARITVADDVEPEADAESESAADEGGAI